MTRLRTYGLLVLSVLVASGSFAADIDPEPLIRALEKHLDAKLRGKLVDADYERSLLRPKLIEQGADPELLAKLLDAKAKAEDRDAARKTLLASGVDAEALDRFVTPPSPMRVSVDYVEKLTVTKVDHDVRSAALGEPPSAQVDHLVTGATLQAHVSVKEATSDGERDAKATWGVTFERKAKKEGEAPVWQVTAIDLPEREFGAANYAVVILYLAAMLGIGWWTSRRIKGTRSFFIADGRLNWFVVGVSILTAYMSALTMMGMPGASFGGLDWLFGAQLPFLILTAFVITRFVLVRYREAGVISVYQFLEQRIHISSRLMASVCFVVFAIGRMGLVLYLPAQAFSIVTGADLLTTIIAMGVVVTVYTIMGGMEAVIWTDFVQAFVMLAGAAVSVVYVLVGTQGQFGAIATAHHKFRMLAPGTDFTRLLTIWLILETIFQTIRIYGTQQDITQRYMTTPSTKDANRSVWIAICGFIPLGFLFLFIGSALFVYYKIHPDPMVAGLIANNRADSIYPYFVASRLHPGLAGLVIAAIFAAAMSSIDACMNANSTVCVEDFYRRFAGRDRPDRHHLNVARWLTLVWGILCIAMAILFIDIKTAQIVWGKIMGISTNGVLGLMALAFLPRKVNKWAAAIGFVTSYLVLFAMMWLIQIKPTFAIGYPVEGKTVSYLIWPVVGNLWCFGVGYVLNLVLPDRTDAES